MGRTVELDFYRDWIELMRDKLASEGLDAQKLRADDVERAFFNFRRRLIPPMPRKVVKAPTFSCPPIYSAGLALLESRIVVGENLAPYLRRKLPRLDFNDGLLNDWGIHHLHLGTEQDGKGRIKGTKEILFARFDEKAADSPTYRAIPSTDITRRFSRRYASINVQSPPHERGHYARPSGIGARTRSCATASPS